MASAAVARKRVFMSLSRCKGPFPRCPAWVASKLFFREWQRHGVSPSKSAIAARGRVRAKASWASAGSSSFGLNSMSFLVKRHARRAIEMRNFENAALLLGKRPSRGEREPQHARCCEHAQVPVHRLLPPVQWRGPTGPTVAPRRPVYRALTRKQHQTIGYHLWSKVNRGGQPVRMRGGVGREIDREAGLGGPHHEQTRRLCQSGMAVSPP